MNTITIMQGDAYPLRFQLVTVGGTAEAFYEISEAEYENVLRCEEEQCR